MSKALKALLPVLALGFAACLLPALCGLATLPLHSRYTLLSVQSGSMLPSLPVHSVVAVDRHCPFPLKSGDIITYRSGGRLITHRVIAAGFDGAFYYITKGDANRGADPDPVREHEVFGRVVFVTPPQMAAFIRFLSSPAASRTLALLLFLLLLRSFSPRPA
jgi:signal peptidase